MSRFSTRSGGSLYLGFVMLFEWRYSYFPPLKNFNETWNHLILVTKECIKRKVMCRMTKGAKFSWGSVPGLCPPEIPWSRPASPWKTPSVPPLLLRLTQYIPKYTSICQYLIFGPNATLVSETKLCCS